MFNRNVRGLAKSSFGLLLAACGGDEQAACVLGGEFEVGAYSGEAIAQTALVCSPGATELPRFICEWTGEPSSVFRSPDCGASPTRAIIRFAGGAEAGGTVVLGLDADGDGRVTGATAGFARGGTEPVQPFDSGRVEIEGMIGPDAGAQGCVRGRIRLELGDESVEGRFLTVECSPDGGAR